MLDKYLLLTTRQGDAIAQLTHLDEKIQEAEQLAEKYGSYEEIL